MKKDKRKKAIPSDKSKFRKLNPATQKGITLITILTILIMIVLILTTSYSWFLPVSQKGTGVVYQISDLAFRSEECTVQHHLGTKNSTTGIITYNENALSGEGLVQTVAAGETVYFETVITNTDTSYPTVVSLFSSAFPSSGASSFGTIGLGVAYPTNSYHTYSVKQDDLYIIRNAYLERNDNNPEDSSLSVEWFVDAGSSNVSVDLTKIYLVYN